LHGPHATLLLLLLGFIFYYYAFSKKISHKIFCFVFKQEKRNEREISFFLRAPLTPMLLAYLERNKKQQQHRVNTKLKNKEINASIESKIKIIH
jgi:hypothetical protein